MRALIVISNLEFGGAQRQVVELANTMDPAVCELHLCCLSEYVPLAAHLRSRERGPHVIRKRFKYDLSVVPRLARLLDRLQVDVVHGYLFDAEIAAQLAGRLAGTPVVVGSERNTDYRLKLRQLLTYRITRACLDCVIANSRAGAAFNSRLLGIPPSRYRVVHNGVDVNKFRPASRDIRRELGLRFDEPVVGMFGSFKAQKNHRMFFAAARRVLEQFPRAQFLLVGDELYKGMHGSDAYKRQMDALVERLGLARHCHFLGNRDDVARLYPACDVTVLPSRFEGTPNVLLESMACGVPVVATDVSDNSYVVPDGRAGHLVQLDDDAALAERIGRLLADEKERRAMGVQARAWVEQEFSTARLAAKTAAVYQELLNAKLPRYVARPQPQPWAVQA